MEAMVYGLDGLATPELVIIGNKALRALAKKNPEFADNFTFSLHHVFPRTVSKNDVLHYESLLKNKLGSRAYGLNEN